MSTDPPLLPPPREESFVGGLLESLARLPLRVLQFPLGPVALAGVSTFVIFAAYPFPDAAWSEPLRSFFQWLAVAFGAAAVLTFVIWRVRDERWAQSILLSSTYLRQVLLLAMLWQIVAGVFVLRSLGPWLELAHTLFQDARAGESMWSGGMESGFAWAFVAVVIYFCPGTLVLAAVAPLALGLAAIPAALRRSRTLPRLLLTGALLQAGYWSGAALTLNLWHQILGPVLQRMETIGVEDTLRERPELLEGLDPQKDRAFLAYLTQPYKTGRPAVRQLGWLLLAPWIFVPMVFVKRRAPAATAPDGGFGGAP